MDDQETCREKIIVRHPADISPVDLLRFIYLPSFERSWKKLKLTHEDRASLEVLIMLSPDGPPVVPRTGGMRKLRFVPARWNVGKSNAARVGYAYLEEFSVVVFVTIFAKSQKEDISAAERNSIKRLLDEIRGEFEKGPKRG